MSDGREKMPEAGRRLHPAGKKAPIFSPVSKAAQRGKKSAMESKSIFQRQKEFYKFMTVPMPGMPFRAYHGYIAVFRSQKLNIDLL